MPYPRHYSKRNEYLKPKTKEAGWTAKKADYLTLALASLALSMAITLIIKPQLQRSPFF